MGNNKMFSIILCIFLSVSCNAQVPSSQDISLVEDRTTKDHYYLYLSATYLHAKGDVLSALEKYKELLKKRPSAQAYNGFFQLLFDLGQYKAIAKTYEAHEKKFEKIFKDNVLIRLIVAQSYLNLDMDKKAEAIFLSLYQTNPDNEQVAYFTAAAYAKNNQIEEAIKIIDKSLKNQSLKQKHFLFHFLKSKLYAQQQDYKKALASIEQSLKCFPRFDRGWLFKAMLYEQMGNINNAIKGYQYFLGIVGRDVMVEKQIIQLLFSQERFTEAADYLRRIRANSPEYFFDLALIEFKAGKDTQALASITKAIQMAPTFNKARLLKAEILLQTKKIKELLSFMRDWIITSNGDLEVLHSFLLLRKAGIQVSVLIKTLQDIDRSKPHHHIKAAIADLFVETNDLQQAIEYYNKLAATTPNNEIKSKALYFVGYLYFMQKQWDKLEDTLQKALTIEPIYPSTYNLLAYHYAHNNKNLNTALELIEKALARDATCSYYLDTKGYILSKMSKYDQAITAYQQALAQTPQDATIKQHLKEVETMKIENRKLLGENK